MKHASNGNGNGHAQANGHFAPALTSALVLKGAHVRLQEISVEIQALAHERDALKALLAGVPASPAHAAPLAPPPPSPAPKKRKLSPAHLAALRAGQQRYYRRLKRERV